MVRVEGVVKVAIADLTPPGAFSDIEGWVVNRINVPADARGKGVGSALLRQICADADEAVAVLCLCINPTGPLGYDALHAWYVRHGFKDDPEEKGWLYREPCV